MSAISIHANHVFYVVGGGAFIFGPMESTPAFWWHIQENLGKRGETDKHSILRLLRVPLSLLLSPFLVFTIYFAALVPDRAFPAQLTQTVLTIQHILDSGVSPENLQLVGDSAGGLLIHEVISHMLHPVEGVPILKISAPLAGAFLMSPWVRLRDTPRPSLENASRRRR